MNKENILALADLIEQQPHTDREGNEGFTMESFTHNCGAPACIAGWACFMAIGRAKTIPEFEAADWLGISRTHAVALFYPDNQIWAALTPTQAAQVLRHFAETGQIDWSIS